MYLLFALALIVALAVALDPDIVRDLEPTLKKWGDTISASVSSIDVLPNTHARQ